MQLDLFSPEEIDVILQIIVKISQDQNITVLEALKLIISYGIQLYQEIEILEGTLV